MRADDREAEIAARLLASHETSGSEPASNYIDHFRAFVAETRTEAHSGDCRKEPWTCSRCVTETALAHARELLSGAFAEPARTVTFTCEAILGGLRYDAGTYEIRRVDAVQQGEPAF